VSLKRLEEMITAVDINERLKNLVYNVLCIPKVSSINYEKLSGVPDYNWIIVNAIVIM